MVSSKPIMVTFGTNRGPIVPPSAPPASTSISNVDQSPAPVNELLVGDTPNPVYYRPLVPHQYRSKVFSFRPSPNLIQSTPIDRKYSLSMDKYDLYKKQGKALQQPITKPVDSFDFRGPHLFEHQDYEEDYYNEQRDFLQRFYINIIPNRGFITQQQLQHRDENKLRSVPEMGIVYSSGLRY